MSLKIFERCKSTAVHAVSLVCYIYIYISVRKCAVFRTYCIFNISQDKARVVMFVCVIVTRYKLRHVVGFYKYVVHNIYISFSFISCYLYVSFASSCLVLFRF
jgi:hypothetical protein